MLRDAEGLEAVELMVGGLAPQVVARAVVLQVVAPLVAAVGLERVVVWMIGRGLVLVLA